MFRCKYCPSAFSFKQNLAQHEKTHRMLKCEKCSVGFVSRKHYNLHMQRAHPIKLLDPEEQIFSCNICFRSILGQRMYLQHMCINHPESAEGGSSASCSTLVQHSTPSGSSSSSSINQQQSIEGGSSASSSIYRLHPTQIGPSAGMTIYQQQLIQSKPSPILSVCQQQPTQSTSSESSSSSQPNSAQCGSSTAERSLKLKCMLCPKKFKNEKFFNRHMLIHNSLRCKMCPYVANWKVCLDIHTKHHQTEYGLKCKHCSYSCTKKKSMTYHMKIHPEYIPE